MHSFTCRRVSMHADIVVAEHMMIARDWDVYLVLPVEVRTLAACSSDLKPQPLFSIPQVTSLCSLMSPCRSGL